MTSSGKQFTVTREMLTAVANKVVVCFPPVIFFDFVSGNIEILGKQNPLFPSGPVIECLVLPGATCLVSSGKNIIIIILKSIS